MSENNVQPIPPPLTSDETVMAALVHGSVILSFLGPIGPMLVWISQRRKSSYAAFHALQAMAYQMAFFWIGMAVGLLLAIFWMCLFFPLMLTSLENDPNGFSFTPFLFEGVLFLFMFSIMGVYFIGGIAGAVMCLLKKDFRYPWVGKRLESYLSFDLATGALDEAKEERFVAAMSHASAILILWGLISPLAVWVTQKDRSPYLRFQGLQATVYQFLAVLGYFAFMALYFLMFIIAFLMIPVSGAMSTNGNLGSFALIAILVIVVMILLIWLVFLLALPTYHLFAMIAGIQILKGKDYRYPLLGNFIARRMKFDEPKKEG